MFSHIFVALSKCRARFQIFGKTVATCNRMATTSVPGQIHISATTANILIDAGAADWISDRSDKVSLSSKGEMETFWLETKTDSRRRKNKARGSDRKTRRQSSSRTSLTLTTTPAKPLWIQALPETWRTCVA